MGGVSRRPHHANVVIISPCPFSTARSNGSQKAIGDPISRDNVSLECCIRTALLLVDPARSDRMRTS